MSKPSNLKNMSPTKTNQRESSLLNLLKSLGTPISDENLRNAKNAVRDRLNKKHADLVGKRNKEAETRTHNLFFLLNRLHKQELEYSENRKKVFDHNHDMQLFIHILEKTARLTPNTNAGEFGRMNHDNAKTAPVHFIIECDKPTKQEEVIRRIGDVLKVTHKRFRDLGGSLQSLFKKHKKEVYYELVFPIPLHDIKGLEHKISRAIRELGKFKRVTPVLPFVTKQIQKKNKNVAPPYQRIGKDNCCCCCKDVSTTSDAGRIRDERPTYQNIPNDTEWHLKQTRVFEAWNLKPQRGGKRKGEGIVVGHPDTGWREHKEYKPKPRGGENILVDQVYDVLTGKRGSRVQQQPAGPQIAHYLPTHGIGTGAFLVSNKAPNGKTHVNQIPNSGNSAVKSNEVELTGVAPLAGIIPIRCNDGPIVLGGSNEQRAVEYAIEENVDVISMSWGGIPDRSLEDVINHAVLNKNIIVVAAAGQNVDFLSPDNSVIEPAAYTNVIAVAGSNQKAKPWDGSCRGQNVDIVAPAQNVWFANFEPDGKSIIVYGEGTSFAAPQVAGIAALWLAYWGRENLRRKYRHKPLAHVFRYIIRKTAWKPSRDWNERLWGPGIIDAYAVLKENLPPESEVPDPAEQKASTFSVASAIKGCLGGRWQDCGELIGSGIGALGKWIESTGVVQYWEDQAATAWAAAAGHTGDAAKALNDLGEEAARKAEDALHAGEDALQQVGEKAEETVDGLKELAGEASDIVEDGGNALVGFVRGFFP